MQFDAKCGESGGAFPPLQRAAARDASRAAGLQPEASGFRHGAHGLARPHKHPPGASPCRRFAIPAPHAAHGGSLCVSAICALQNGGHKEQKAPFPAAGCHCAPMPKGARTTSQPVCAARLTPARFTPLQNSHRCRTAWGPLHPLRTGSGRSCASVCLFRRHSMPRNGPPAGNKTRPPYTAARNRG